MIFDREQTLKSQKIERKNFDDGVYYITFTYFTQYIERILNEIANDFNHFQQHASEFRIYLN